MSKPRRPSLFDVLDFPQAATLTALEKLAFVYLAWRRGRNQVAWPSLKTIAEDLHIDSRTCVRVLTRLSDSGCIVKEPGGGRGRSNRYRVPSNETGARHPSLSNGKQGDFGSANRGISVDKQGRGTPRSKRNNIRTTSSPEDEAYSPLFERVWAAYPKKEFKAEAWSCWRDLAPSAELAERILESVRKHAECARWVRSLAEDGGHWVPTLKKFLLKRRWEDSPAAKPKPKRGDPNWLPDEDEVDAILASAGLLPPRRSNDSCNGSQ